MKSFYIDNQLSGLFVEGARYLHRNSSPKLRNAENRFAVREFYKNFFASYRVSKLLSFQVPMFHRA